MERFFLNPWALALGALAGGIVLLYILRLKRSKVRVSSTLLWERSVQDTRANAPWQKLRFNWLMLLQILALLLLAIALARPFIFGTALGGGRSILVLDTSASMLATDARPSRLEQALDAASEAIGDLKPGDEAMLIAAGPEPRVLSGFVRDKRALQQALAEARQGAGGEADLNAALKLASSVVSGGNARVVVFSDGALPDLDPFATGDLRIDFFPVGDSSDNIGIVGAGARRNMFDDRFELFVALHNYYGVPREIELTFSAAEQPLDVRTVMLEPGRRAELTLPNIPYIADPVEVSIDGGDSLAADDRAYIVMPRKAEYNIGLATARESVLLRKVLASIKDARIYEVQGGTASGLPAGASIDLYIVDGDVPAPADVTASYLYLDTTSHAFLPVIPGEVAELDFDSDPPIIPAVVGVQRSHPLLRFVGVADLKLSSMRRVQPHTWARTVVDGTQGPLVVEGVLEGQRTVYLAFDIYASDFPLRAAFPMFMANAVRYLGESGSGTARSIPAGQRVDLLAPLSAVRAEITDPSGRRSAAQLGTRDFTLGRTAEAGLYQLAYFDEGGAQVGADIVPVSLLSDAESNITPGRTLRVRGAEEALAGASAAQVQEITGRREVRVNREFYTWLILIVLLLISAEWWLFHQRAL